MLATIILASILFGIVHFLMSLIRGISSSVALGVAFFVAIWFLNYGPKYFPLGS